MKRILIANTYFYRLDPKQWRFKQPYPPLATILAAAVLREHGFTVDLFDTNLRHSPNEIIPLLAAKAYDAVVFFDDGFNYLSKMCLTNMREAAFEMIRQAKLANAKVLVASSDASDHQEKYLRAGADVVLNGEAEQTLVDVLAENADVNSLQHLTGVSYLLGEDVITTSPRVVNRELDHLPIPAWDLVSLSDYRTIWQQHHGYFSLNIATTRGCPFKCNWCAKPIYGNRYNSRSPEHVVREIDLLVTKYGAEHLWMCDDIFGLKPGWIDEFSELVKLRNLKFRYKIQSRVDLLLEEKTVESLASSGAETVWVGAESGSQKVLDAMDKGTTVEQIAEATKKLKQYNIRVAFFLQFGYLGEVREDIEKTIAMLLDLMPDEIGISVSYPLPGTKFYKIVKDQLREKQNWTDSDDLAMMFQSTFHGNYYKKLHRFVHSLYRRKKGIIRLKEILRSPLKINSRDVKMIAGIIYFGVQAFILKRKLHKLSHQESPLEISAIPV